MVVVVVVVVVVMVMMMMMMIMKISHHNEFIEKKTKRNELIEHTQAHNIS